VALGVRESASALKRRGEASGREKYGGSDRFGGNGIGRERESVSLLIERADRGRESEGKRVGILMRVNEEKGAFMVRGCECEIFCGRNVYIYWCGNSVPSSYLIIQFRRFQHFVIEINFMFRLYSFNKF
jgi:hypothetical protein